MITSQFVRPFVKSNQNDFVDAEAICEAASHPSMRFMTAEQATSRQCLLDTGSEIGNPPEKPVYL
ncbi:Uncharacterized protein YR821_3352 [Yersinia ruckeri]|uniref:Transposase n=1 Tax=Yersinia ruckeri TaxID=29486 RepID=A0A0A8VNL6_YERRU|nr:Uncharacterized protein YR821_3352 [Yersinia ruckeri]CEK29181.1 Transposase [Yersinia ruckeri]